MLTLMIPISIMKLEGKKTFNFNKQYSEIQCIRMKHINKRYTNKKRKLWIKKFKIKLQTKINYNTCNLNYKRVYKDYYRLLTSTSVVGLFYEKGKVIRFTG